MGAKPLEAVERLRQDHVGLWAQLDALEAACRRPQEHVREGLREVCQSLSRQLLAHIRREGRLVTACNLTLGRVGTHELGCFAIEHHASRNSLWVVRRALSRSLSVSLDGLQPLLRLTVTQLRRQIEEQEDELFPLLERIVGRRRIARQRAPLTSGER